MTRKDYIQIAEIFAVHRQIACDDGHFDQVETIESLASDMAFMLRRDNPRFDRHKFLAACGVK